MHPLDLTANELSAALLDLAAGRAVCILDSCGVTYLDSHLMIAGIEPQEVHEISLNDSNKTLNQVDKLLSKGLAAIFTLSYDFGRRIQSKASDQLPLFDEPDVFMSLFDTLAVHDYYSNGSFLTGDIDTFGRMEDELHRANFLESTPEGGPPLQSSLTRSEYITAVETIKEYIRRGDTYQTNLTQQFNGKLAEDLNAETIFARLRRDHPAPFSAYLKRPTSTVVSASPERFFKTRNGSISASPIKGTRKRGVTPDDDLSMLNGLATSGKDRAENTMIVDLLRNDLGRICEYGSVVVEELCKIETHPTFHHMVSTINGRVRKDTAVSSILRALFPCGSITGAPKLRTMEIIDELESQPRGVSMGAIGYFIPDNGFEGLTPGLDLSVAIRTMVVKGAHVRFNVGGGITIESDPVGEYDESMLKAKALFAALGNKK